MTYQPHAPTFDTIFTRAANGILKPIVRLEISPKSTPVFQFPRNKK